MNKNMKRILSLIISMIMMLMLCSCTVTEDPDLKIPDLIAPDIRPDPNPDSNPDLNGGSISLSEIPPYNGKDYYAVNNNTPFFTSDELKTEGYEYYGDLDSLGRCTITHACVGKETMPTDPRGEIGMIKPTGWHTVKYDCVEGKYLYNRSHLIGFQLTGENANKKNLITGTRYFNVQGMLPFENMVADYVKETGNHVMYRVTPMFDGNNLLAHGVLMEAFSVEDNGAGVCYNVFVYNIQPGVGLDYATGDSWLEDNGTQPQPDVNPDQGIEKDYVLNTNSKKFHDPSCASVSKMNPANREDYHGTRENLVAQGYQPCGSCKP